MSFFQGIFIPLPRHNKCTFPYNFETISPISILFQNLLTYFNHRFQKCKVPFCDRGILIIGYNEIHNYYGEIHNYYQVDMKLGEITEIL